MNIEWENLSEKNKWLVQQFWTRGHNRRRSTVLLFDTWLHYNVNSSVCYTRICCYNFFCNIMRCSIHCTILHWSVLYCTVLYYTVLYCTTLFCTVLHCTVLCYTVLYFFQPKYLSQKYKDERMSNAMPCHDYMVTWGIINLLFKSWKV